MAQTKKDKKEQIRRAAVTVIARDGFHVATTDKIALEAGVAVGTIYNYFKSKEDILTNIFQVEAEKRNSFYQIISMMDLSPLEKIRSVLEMRFAAVNNSPELVRILLNEKNGYLRINNEESAKDDKFQGFIFEVIEGGIASGLLRPCDIGIIAKSIAGAVEAVIEGFFTDGSINMEEAKEELIFFIGKGILSQ